MRRERRWSLFWSGSILALFSSLLISRAAVLEENDSPASLKKLSLEELMNVEITSVSKKEEKLTGVAASVQVITEEEIRRSGANNLPQAMRSAFNLQVAQFDSQNWAISARGFNGVFANKLLVLMDGRNVYSPLFSGVLWDVQDTFLQDLDRIEVVSGPGGAVWGANAINGVINIVSKSARDTQGFLTYAGGGTQERAFAGLRYGGQISENAYYRVYTKYSNRDETQLANGMDGNDGGELGQAGFRIDWEPSDENLLTLQGDVYKNDGEAFVGGDIHGGNILGRWTRTLSETSDLQAQFYYDRIHRLFPGATTDEQDTFDFDFQHRFEWLERNEMNWGLGYRLVKSESDNIPRPTFIPARLERNLFTAFIQDKITLKEDRLFLTLGSIFEHNEYTGFELQPSVRLAWNATERQALWGAISRAVRTPSRLDRHNVNVRGPGFDSETLIAYELGYRAQLHERVTFSLATFYNVYDELRSAEPAPALVWVNGLEGETYGAELETAWQALDWWRLRAGYTHLHKQLRTKPGFSAVNFGVVEGSDPQHQFFLRSSMDLGRGIELDASARYVDLVENVPSALFGTVPSYMELDVRIGWRPTENLELSLVGQNLLDHRHPEFGFSLPTRVEIERSFYGKVTWRF